jgi:hypothetical protein
MATGLLAVADASSRANTAEDKKVQKAKPSNKEVLALDFLALGNRVRFMDSSLRNFPQYST